MGVNLASLSATAAKGITASQIDALSASQLTGFTAAQKGGAVGVRGVGTVEADRRRDRAGRLQVAGQRRRGHLQRPAQGVAGRRRRRHELGQVVGAGQDASELNVAGGIKTSAYDQQIFADVVDGNSANATWTGGAATSVALGNLVGDVDADTMSTTRSASGSSEPTCRPCRPRSATQGATGSSSLD